MGGIFSSSSVENVQPYSSEYQFCDKFLGLCDSTDQREYRVRFQASPDGRIDWSFWTGRSPYQSAYDETMERIPHLTDVSDLRELCTLAAAVVEHRKSQLNRATGDAYHRHRHVVRNWKNIEDKLRERSVQLNARSRQLKAEQEEGGMSVGGALAAGVGIAAAGFLLYAAFNREENNEDSSQSRGGQESGSLSNRANQLNPNHSRTGPGRPSGYSGLGTRDDLRNHSNQLNPNHPAYWSSRGGGGSGRQESSSETNNECRIM